MTTDALEYKWITEVKFCFLKIFGSLQNRMEGRVLLIIGTFSFSMAQYLHTCNLARWLSHMGAPLLDYFPPSDGNLSPMEKIFSPCFSSALFCPQFCTGDFASKGSFPLLISALCKLWQPRCRALTQARKKCVIVISYELRGITTIFGPQYWIQVCFQKKIVFNKDMSFSLKVVILHIYSLVVWN